MYRAVAFINSPSLCHCEAVRNSCTAVAIPNSFPLAKSAFPLGGRCRRRATDEGKSNQTRALNNILPNSLPRVILSRALLGVCKA